MTKEKLIAGHLEREVDQRVKWDNIPALRVEVSDLKDELNELKKWVAQLARRSLPEV